MDKQKEMTHFVKVIIEEKGKDHDILLEHSQNIGIIEVLEAVFTLFAYAKEDYDHTYDEYRETAQVIGNLLYGDGKIDKKH